MNSLKATLTCLGTLGLALACSSQSSGLKTPMTGTPVASPSATPTRANAETLRDPPAETGQEETPETPETTEEQPPAGGDPASPGFVPPNKDAPAPGGGSTETKPPANTPPKKEEPVGKDDPVKPPSTTNPSVDSEACVAGTTVLLRYIKKPAPLYEFARKDSRPVVASVPGGIGAAATEVEYFMRAKNGFACVRLKTGGKELGWVNVPDANLGEGR